ncbi:YbaN family protein [Bacteroidales bacterium OttesenSCG-928-I21]|nr:YbaN family protein [Bacteroidales bacterium OttesenSCG-928-I21]
MLKIFFIIAGTLCVFLGMLGIFIPGLPTTPFLLLAASLYVRSSDKLYQKLIKNKVLGKYIQNYRKNKGISKKTKIYAICLMWTMISCSVIFFIKINYVKFIVIVLGVIGTIVMGFVVKTVSKEPNENSNK